MLLKAGWTETADFVSGFTSDAYFLELTSENPKTHGLVSSHISPSFSNVI